jgi:hypothetical protein
MPGGHFEAAGGAEPRRRRRAPPLLALFGGDVPAAELERLRRVDAVLRRVAPRDLDDTVNANRDTAETRRSCLPSY